MGKFISIDDSGYWFDPLEHIWYVEREDDPKEYSFICPHCQKRYGAKARWIEVSRCEDCPKFIVGLDTPRDFTGKRRQMMIKLGYFKQKTKGEKNETV